MIEEVEMKSLFTAATLTVLLVCIGIDGAASASAGVGLSVLPGESFPITFEAQNKGGRLVSAVGVVECTGEKATGEIESATLGKASDNITGCKEAKGMTKVACNTEGDAKETILVLNVKGGAVSLLNGKVLVPGVANILTENLKVKCGGVALIEVKGSTIGLFSVSSLSADVTEGTLKSGGEKDTCVEEKTLCEKLAKEPLLVNFTGTFEKATTELEGVSKSSKMVLVND